MTTVLALHQAFMLLFPEAKSPTSELPTPDHDVYVLDVDRPNNFVHVAQYDAENGIFVSGGGWFEASEVHAWAYVPNAEQQKTLRMLTEARRLFEDQELRTKMKTIHYRDSHLKEALEFAATQDRAVIVCDYVDSLTRVSEHLESTAPVVVLKAPYNSRIIREALEKFESLAKGYLAVTKGLMSAGGFLFTRDVAIACAGPLTEMSSHQLIHRLPLQNPCTHFMKVLP